MRVDGNPKGIERASYSKNFQISINIIYDWRSGETVYGVRMVLAFLIVRFVDDISELIHNN